jgi:hypothetical protein
MMKSIILCEGKTDLYLLSYYLGKVAGWKSVKSKAYKEMKRKLEEKLSSFANHSDNQEVEWYFNDNEDVLCIFATGSNNMIKDGLKQVINLNMNTSEQNFDKVAVVSDRDDEHVEAALLREIKAVLTKNNIGFDTLVHNQWNVSNPYLTNGLEDEHRLSLLPIIIPFDENGTIETFLLNARKEIDPAEKRIVTSGNDLVDVLAKDPDVKSKYLSPRGIRPKAKLGVYFAIVSPNRTYDEGNRVLLSIPWEELGEVQRTFKELAQI